MQDIRFVIEMPGRGLFDVSFKGVDPTYDWDIEDLTEDLKHDFLQGKDKALLPMCLTGTYYKNGEGIAIYDLVKYQDQGYNKPTLIEYKFQTTAS